ncbi:TetR/AcrR family transcriptional regulator [Pseudarthrobacter sp. NPDC058362]|uniref:TetR/AcrR family transcriptional regulator n=1 Tax=Pseudarthrobacter sp. NPDC058362 TaxID=3346458 RepID=UPI00364B0355
MSAHRTAVREAILDATVSLAAEHGVLSVTMSDVAASAGVSRATLYKYFPDVQSILQAEHHRQMAGELEQLHSVKAAGGDPRRQLEQVLRIHAMVVHRHHDSAIAAVLQQSGALQHKEQFLEVILRKAADDGTIRTDIAPAELTRFCLHALAAAAQAGSEAEVDRLVRLTLDALEASAPR